MIVNVGANIKTIFETKKSFLICFVKTFVYICIMKLTIKEQKHLYDLRTLIVKYGYWSKEVNDFNNGLDHSTMVKINNIIKNE